MRISPVNVADSIPKLAKAGTAPDSSGSAEFGPAGRGFRNAVEKAVAEGNNLQHQADDLAVKLATGDVEDVHKAMIAMNKAKLALDFTIQVRNKVVEAYQEIMRMQV